MMNSYTKSYLGISLENPTVFPPFKASLRMLIQQARHHALIQLIPHAALVQQAFHGAPGPVFPMGMSPTSRGNNGRSFPWDSWINQPS